MVEVKEKVVAAQAIALWTGAYESRLSLEGVTPITGIRVPDQRLNCLI